MPIDKSMSKEEIIAELMRAYKAHGRIGTNTHIANEEEARKIAAAIAYGIKE